MSEQKKDPVERVVEAVATGVAVDVAAAAAVGFIIGGPVGAIAAVKTCGVASAINAACNSGSGG